LAIAEDWRSIKFSSPTSNSRSKRMIVGCFSLWICVNRRVCEIHGFCSPVLRNRGIAYDLHSFVSSR
jgi:hypothetical protein